MEHPPVPGRCPVCSELMAVRRVECHTCGTAVEGVFAAPKFSRLSADQLRFVEVFLQARGNIKEVERELGISYPTVRNRLDAVLVALGYEPDADAVAAERADRQNQRLEVLDALSRGEIDSEEALERLRQLQKGGSF